MQEKTPLKLNNLHTNRQSSSRNIAKRFAVMEQLYFLLNKGVAPEDATVRVRYIV